MGAVESASRVPPYALFHPLLPVVGPQAALGVPCRGAEKACLDSWGYAGFVGSALRALVGRFIFILSVYKAIDVQAVANLGRGHSGRSC